LITVIKHRNMGGSSITLPFGVPDNNLIWSNDIIFTCNLIWYLQTDSQVNRRNRKERYAFMQVYVHRHMDNNAKYADEVLVHINTEKKQRTINTGKWTMCYDKCVKFNQRQNFKIHLWNLSFNTVIMGIILYWRVFHYGQVKWAVNFTWRWFPLLELNNLQRQETEQYIWTQTVSCSYQIKYS
jgi:hypothetical protein